MYRKTCPECEGLGTSGRLELVGPIGVHVSGTCPTCKGKCWVPEGWVEHYNRVRLENFICSYRDQHGRKPTTEELKGLGVSEEVLKRHGLLHMVA